MKSASTLEAVVTEEGLVVPPEALDRIGAHPGDRVVVNVQPAVRIKPMQGFGARTGAAAFTDEDLREVRRAMGEGIGDDLTR